MRSYRASQWSFKIGWWSMWRYVTKVWRRRTWRAQGFTGTESSSFPWRNVKPTSSMRDLCTQPWKQSHSFIHMAILKEFHSMPFSKWTPIERLQTWRQNLEVPFVMSTLEIFLQVFIMLFFFQSTSKTRSVVDNLTSGVLKWGGNYY